MARGWEKANPMTEAPVNVTAGKHTSGKVGEANNPKGGAGSLMGPSIASGWLVSGKADTHATGGKFAKANKAKMTKRSKKGGK